MVQSATGVIGDADVVLYLFDATEDNISEGDKNIISQIKAGGKKSPVILIFTKIDLIEKEKLLRLTEMLAKEYEFDDIIPVSARERDGINIIEKEIVKRLPEGPEYYPGDIITDSTVREMTAEIIREKILLYTNEEVPHGTGVEIVVFEEARRKEGKARIEANIFCEKESHKGILIGKDGAMLKRIGTAARRDIERIEGTGVNLKLWVKVKEDWRNSPGMLKELGYREQK
jgi:GTP-binding protein Era